MKRALFTITVVAITNTSFSHDRANCKDIDNALSRLGCYDESHAPTGFAGDASSQLSLPKAASSRTLNPDTQSTSAKQPSGLFSREQGKSYKATLTEVFKHPKRMTRLYLDNDQVWGLVKERMLAASAGDSVEIKPGTMGGFRMSINNGSWFRVKRLN